MTAKFGYNIRTFANNNFVKSIKIPSLDNWVEGKTYAVGSAVFSNGAKYISITSPDGISGGYPPIHSSGIATDGGVSWVFSEAYPVDYPFYGNLYSFLGRIGLSSSANEWPVVGNPETPDLSDNGATRAIKDIATLRKIESNEMRFGIKRHKWVSGNVYNQYNPNKDPYSQSGSASYGVLPFYCVTDNFLIYKCINNNNGGASMVQPTGESTAFIDLGDGYTWKYMGKVDLADKDNFVTDSYVPVEYKSADDATNQWDVQQGAKNGEISTFKIIGVNGVIAQPIVTLFADLIAYTTDQKTGADKATAYVPSEYNNVTMSKNFGRVLITKPGIGYNNNYIAIIRDTRAPGSGAYTNGSNSPSNTNRVTIVNKRISSIVPAAGGSNYDAVKVIIVGDGEGATATATVTGGSVNSAVNIDNPGTSDYTWARAYFIPTNSTKTYGGAVAEVILAPRNGHGANIARELGSNALIFNIKTSSTSAQHDYYLFGDEYKFRQLGIITDVKENNGGVLTPAKKSFYISSGHPKYTDNGSALNKIDNNWGEILYMSNFPAIERAAGQEENIRITAIF